MSNQKITEVTPLLFQQHSPAEGTAGTENQIPDVAVPNGTIHGPSPTSTASPETKSSNTKLSTSRAWLVITQLCGINFVSGFSNGLLTIGMPAIASTISISDSLLLWPVSMFFLTGGSSLLVAGALADVIGPRKVQLAGCFLVALFILASGLARVAEELILYRAFQGVANAMVVPTAVSIISTNIEHGTPRNIGFAMIFLANPLGFAMGLVLAGVFVSGVGWRVGFYIAAGVGFCSFAVGTLTLPKDPQLGSWDEIVRKLVTEIDWIGAAIASGSLAIFSYTMAILAEDPSEFKHTQNIVLFVISLALMMAFLQWTWYQERRGKPALIPYSIWKNGSFSTACLLMLISNGVLNSMELFSSLLFVPAASLRYTIIVPVLIHHSFQKVQQLPAIDASIRILPQVIIAVVLEFLSGILVNKVPVIIPVVASSILCAGAPFLMAIIDPEWSYWVAAFWAQVLAPVSVDILFTVCTLIISSALPAQTQALGGAVFGVSVQLGASVGICVMSVISAGVTANSRFEDKQSPEAIMEGYRVTFWTLFASMLAVIVIGGYGLRRMGTIGTKKS